jgi:hypothetical protein
LSFEFWVKYENDLLTFDFYGGCCCPNIKAKPKYLPRAAAPRYPFQPAPLNLWRFLNISLWARASTAIAAPKKAKGKLVGGLKEQHYFFIAILTKGKPLVCLCKLV